MQPIPDTQPVIARLQDVSFALPGASGLVHILQHLDVTIYKNETLAVIGPSGSGKTSMMMMLAGLESPSAGSIVVCGEEITRKSEDELARWRARNIGIVFQSFHLIPTMTALENVAIPLEFGGAIDAKDRAREALISLGLAARLTHYPSQLSGGEQQRVAIARAFVTNPPLLLADEPTGNLDRDTGAQVIELLFNLQKTHGTTLMLITHDDTLAGRCSRVVRMRDGRIEAGKSGRREDGK